MTTTSINGDDVTRTRHATYDGNGLLVALTTTVADGDDRKLSTAADDGDDRRRSSTIDYRWSVSGDVPQILTQRVQPDDSKGARFL